MRKIMLSAVLFGSLVGCHAAPKQCATNDRRPSRDEMYPQGYTVSEEVKGNDSRTRIYTVTPNCPPSQQGGQIIEVKPGAGVPLLPVPQQLKQ